jgi:hypothetical protein
MRKLILELNMTKQEREEQIMGCEGKALINRVGRWIQ